MNMSGIGGNGSVDTTGGGIGLSGVLSGSGGLHKAGPGTLILSASNGYTGDTIVKQGRLSWIIRIWHFHRTSGSITQGWAAPSI